MELLVENFYPRLEYRELLVLETGPDHTETLADKVKAYKEGSSQGSLKRTLVAHLFNCVIQSTIPQA